MRRARLIAALALALGLGATLTACGGDSSPEQPIDLQVEETQTQASESLGKADFIDEADAICEEANSSIATFVEQGQGFTGAAEIADIRQGVLQDIRRLEAPPDDRAALDQFLNALEAQVEAGNKIGLAIEREEDTTGFESELEQAQTDAEQAATTYGFTECGSEVTADDATATGTGTGGDAGAVPAEPAPVTPAPEPDTGGGVGGDTGGDAGDGGGGGTGGGVGVP
jgi:uncharacterized protein HemX